MSPTPEQIKAEQERVAREKADRERADKSVASETSAQRVAREKASREAIARGEYDPTEVRLQWTGDQVYRGADEFLSISLTCKPGDVVKVSKSKATELLKDPAWKPYKPNSSAASRGVPGEEGRAASTAMHTGGDE